MVLLSRIPPLLVLALILIVSNVAVLFAQDLGGGVNIRDIMGGAALIFRRPENPIASNRGRPGGGRMREQDRIIARANAARSAPKPRFSDAEREYRLAAQSDPNDARAYAGLGNIFIDQGRFAEAVDSYREAIKLQSDYLDAYLPLGYALVRLKRLDEAIEVYSAAAKLDPANPEIYTNLGYMYNHTERYAEAVKMCHEAIRLLGKTGEAFKQGFQVRDEVLGHSYKNLGNAYFGLRQYKEAIEALKQATATDPNSAAGHFNLGLVYYVAGQHAEAADSYKRALELRPGLAAAHFNLALSYLSMHNQAAALEQYNALKSINPSMAEQLYKMIKQ